VDVVLPVSQASGTNLADWLLTHGHPAERLPPIRPILLPEEVSGVARVAPRLVAAEAASSPIEFVTIGTVCAHKNQLSAMKAFIRLTTRRPDLDLRFHVIGTVMPDCAAPASLIAKRSAGRIQLHGHVPDAELGRFRSRARASVFVSLAEGYGLPVAESMWCGIPCLCSNDGSIGELARAGGCLTVDPRSLDEIELGFEALATDAARYGGLLKEIARRRMKRWSDYAAAVISEIAGHSLERAEIDPISGGKGGVGAAVGVAAQVPEGCLPSAETSSR
jgi:glycosyltransferase involved in cell wall biosynthesis